MRYVVSNNENLYGISSRYGRMSIEKSLEILYSMDIIGFDIETSGLDIFKDRLVCVQLGNKHIQILIDISTIDINNYRDLLESDKTFLGAGLKFDLKFMHNFRIIIRNVHDLILAEQVLLLGYPRNYHASLEALSNKYLKISMDKSFRANIGREGLSERVIVYSCEDVAHLEDIVEKQNEELDKEDLLTACFVEDQFLIPLAYMEWCGVEISEERWMEKVKEDRIELIKTLNELNQAVIEYSLEHPSPGRIFYFDPYSLSDLEKSEWVNNNRQGGKNATKKISGGKRVPVRRSRLKRREDLDKIEESGSIRYKTIAYESTAKYPYIYEDTQMSLFGEESEKYVCDINWSSSIQVIPLLEELGCDVMVEDKNSPSGFKKSCDKKKIAPQAHKHKIIELYVKYKIQDKINSTYGIEFLDNRNTVTRRIHTDYKQLGADTTRMSSTNPNMQNLPGNKRTRRCFTAPEGWKFVSSDYSGQESVLMTDASKDEMMMKEFTEGDKDMHSVFTRVIFEELADKSTKEIKEKYYDERKIAKPHEF